MKTYWMGEDIEQLPREKLIEIIVALGRQMERQHKVVQHSIIEINAMTRAARSRHQ